MALIHVLIWQCVHSMASNTIVSVPHIYMEMAFCAQVGYYNTIVNR